MDGHLHKHRFRSIETSYFVIGNSTEQDGINGGVVLLGADFTSDDSFDFSSYYYSANATLVFTKSGGVDKYTLTGKVVTLTDFINGNMENALDISLNYEGSTQELEPEEEEFEF